MVKKKEEKKEISVKKVNKEKKKEVKNSLADQRNDLIMGLKKLLLTNTQLKRGGSTARRIHQHESSAYNAVIEEINNLGKQLGIGPVSLGKLRKE